MCTYMYMYGHTNMFDEQSLRTTRHTSKFFCMRLSSCAAVTASNSWLDDHGTPVARDITRCRPIKKLLLCHRSLGGYKVSGGRHNTSNQMTRLHTLRYYHHHRTHYTTSRGINYKSVMTSHTHTHAIANRIKHGSTCCASSFTERTH